MNARTAIKEGFATGMLYADNQADALEMSFDRRKIINTTPDAMKRMVALCTPPPDPAPPPDQIDAMQLEKERLALICAMRVF
jgi:hypothetical protein